MIIGIDFDNTIVDYSGVFFDTAIGLGWLKNGQSGSSKEEVKHYFVSKGLESKWTELQGIVYGKTIAEAKPYSGVVSCLKHWAESGHELKIISHKTKYPIVGDKLDFHSAALNWLECHIFSENDVLTSLRNKVFFNSTIDLK
ncbi:HAD family hydrolase, partial [Paraglaciecola sp.]|uniref:HAD family hydrolase n=1 Tax=Paraglaciecola sp. TaxID=1920173 RepID=UPI003EF5EE37